MNTISINLIDIFGVAMTCDVIFKPADTPFINGSALMLSGARSVRLDANGSGSVSLQPGRYAVTFSGIVSNTDLVYITVPAVEGAYTLTSLVGWGAGVVNAAPGNLLSGNNLSDLTNPQSAFENIKQSASITQGGVVEIATQAEVDAGGDDVRAMTPNTFANAAKWAQKADVNHTHTAAQITDASAAGRALLTAVDVVAQQAVLGIQPAPVQSVAGKGGAVTLTPVDVGLGNVANVDATNASNLTSGTVPSARGGAGAVNGMLKADGNGMVSQAVAGKDYLSPSLPNAIYLAATWFSNETKLRLAVSGDGTHWSFIGGAALYSGPTNVCRDTSIRRLSDGNWWIIYCGQNSGGGSLAYVAKSADLLNWSYVSVVDFSAIGNVTDTYGPQWFQDPNDSSYTGLHAFAAISTAGTGGAGPFQIYESHPLDATLTRWSAPVQITGTNLPANIIDPAIYKIGATYYFWYKRQDSNIGYIELATSASLTSGYTVSSQQTNNWLGIGTGMEGPSLLDIGNGAYRLFCDAYGSSPVGVRYVDFANGLQSAPGAIADVVTPVRWRHCDAVRISDVDVIRQVMAAMWLANGLFRSTQIAIGNYANGQDCPDGTATWSFTETVLTIQRSVFGARRRVG